MLSEVEAFLYLELEEEARKRKRERLKQHQSLIDFYRSNPLDYISDRLGVIKETIDWALMPEYDKHRWDGTENPFMKILTALAINKWVGVESATGVGKTFIGACIVFWFLECFENSIVVTTAPKQDQLTLHIWKEIGKLHNNFGRGNLTTLKLRMRDDKEDWIAVGFVAGIKANEESSTRAQGFHAEHMLIIFEETPGIPQQIITALENTCTAPHNLILAFGNPDHERDNLHKFCMMSNVEHVIISALDHPNIVLDNANFIPGAASRSGLQRMLYKYGSADNPFYKSRARGISPAQGIDALIKIEWVREAQKRYLARCDENGVLPSDSLKGEKSLGVDVANSEFGDKAAICEGIENVCIKVEDFVCPDSNLLGRQVYQKMTDENISGYNVGIDGVGVGAGTINTLKELGEPVVNLQGAASPEKYDGEEEFINLRSQMYWQAREDLRKGFIDMPPDDELVDDLVAPKWSTRQGKIVVESKEEIKKRLGRSPNKGDSFVYWNWVRRSFTSLEVVTRGKRESNKLLHGYN